MSHKKTFLLAAALLPAVLLPSQNERQPQTAPEATTKRGGQNEISGVAQSDAILATMLHVGSSNEVTLAQAALKQAQNPEVRAFAQQMVTDHTAWSSTLQPLTGGLGRGAGSDGKGERNKPDPRENADPRHGQNDGRDPKQNPNSENAAEASTQRAAATGGSFDHSALIRDLGKKCVESEVKMLSGKTGAEFDRCYMAMQVASHVRAADMIEVFKAYASPAMTPTLEAGQRTIAKHLEHAKSLCKQLEEGSGNGRGSAEKAPSDGR